MIPVLNGIGGNLASILGARLTSALHTGIIEPKLNNKELKLNVALIIALGFSVFSIIAIIIYLLGGVFDIDNTFALWKLLVIFIGAGGILIILLSAICVVSVLVSHKRGIDPDNVVIPIVTCLGDFIGIVSLMGMYYIVAG